MRVSVREIASVCMCVCVCVCVCERDIYSESKVDTANIENKSKKSLNLCVRA